MSSNNSMILSKMITSYPRTFMPKTVYKSIFNKPQSLPHPGIESFLKLVKSRYYWLNIGKSMKEFCLKCVFYEK